MKKRILPVSYPTITSMPEHADLLSVLENDKRTLPWIYNNFVQLYMLKDINRPTPIFFRHFLFEICPLIRYQRFTREFVSRKWKSLLPFIEECIDANWYVYLNLDQYYISHSIFYRKKHRPHPTMIFGYNQYDNSVAVADFYKNLKYSFEYEKADEICMAYNCDVSLLDFYDRRFNASQDVILFSPINEILWDFNDEMFIGLLTNYINSTNSAQHLFSYDSIWLNDSNFSYGLSVYDTCIDRIKYMIDSNSESFKGFHMFSTLRDHKVIMRNRLAYLYEKRKIANIAFLDSICSDLIDTLGIMQNLAIKYNFNREKDLLFRLAELYKMTKEQDYRFTHSLLDQLICGENIC